jgi:biopolymer transport protein ExbD
MRRKRLSPAIPDAPATDTASLVDISFLLLVFFLVTSSILKRENDLPMTLPPPAGDTSIPALPVWVGIAEDGTVSLGHQEGAMVMGDATGTTAIAELAGHLRMAREAARPQALPIVMDVADGARQQRFIDVLDCLAALGIDQITMVAR